MIEVNCDVEGISIFEPYMPLIIVILIILFIACVYISYKIIQIGKELKPKPENIKKRK